MGYSFRLAARVLLYVPSHRQDNTSRVVAVLVVVVVVTVAVVVV